MQAHLHNQTQVEMQASHSLIVNVTASARGLHEAVDGAAAKIANMAWFGAIPGELFRLGWLVLAVAVLHWYSPNHAKFVAAVIGEFPLSIGTSMLTRSRRVYDTCARLWYPEQPRIDPSGLEIDSPCFRLPNPSLGAHQTCCSSRHCLNNRRCHLPVHQCF